MPKKKKEQPPKLPEKFRCPKCKNEDLRNAHVQERGLVNCMTVSLSPKTGKLLIETGNLEGYDTAKYVLMCDCGEEISISHSDIAFEE